MLAGNLDSDRFYADGILFQTGEVESRAYLPNGGSTYTEAVKYIRRLSFNANNA